MKYMLLICTSPELGEPVPGSPEWDAYGAEYFKFDDEVRKKGVHVAGDALQDTDTATTVRVRDGKIGTTDGPFAETKEILGGYYILDCKDLDEAIAYAAKIPGARYGAIEIRPIMVFE